MAGEVRRLKFLEGVTVVAPVSYSIASGSILAFANDADYVASEGTAQDGSYYYNTTLNVIRLYGNNGWQSYGHEKRSGIVDLAFAEDSKIITFSSPYQDANYVPSVSILCDDSNPIFMQFIIKNVTVNGFEVKLNSATDSINYKIAYSIGAQI